MFCVIIRFCVNIGREALSTIRNTKIPHYVQWGKFQNLPQFIGHKVTRKFGFL